MTTTGEAVTAALEEILEEGEEADLEAAELSKAIFAMNNMMLALDAGGVTLGYTKVSSVSDPITIPDGAIEGLVKNLAIKLAPQYDATVTAALNEAAQDGMEVMEMLGVTIDPTALPSTLPVGSGNEECGNWSDRFYPGPEDGIDGESNGNIILETGTEDAS